MEDEGSDQGSGTTVVLLLAGFVALSTSAYAYVMMGMTDDERKTLVKDYPFLTQIVEGEEEKPKTDEPPSEDPVVEKEPTESVVTEENKQPPKDNKPPPKDNKTPSKDKKPPSKDKKPLSKDKKPSKWSYYSADGGDCLYQSGGKLCMGQDCVKKPVGQFSVSRVGDRFSIRNNLGQCITSSKKGSTLGFSACKSGEKKQMWKPWSVGGGYSHLETGGMCIAGLKKGGLGCGKSPVMLPCTESNQNKTHEFRWKPRSS